MKKRPTERMTKDLSTSFFFVYLVQVTIFKIFFNFLTMVWRRLLQVEKYTTICVCFGKGGGGDRLDRSESKCEVGWLKSG